MDDTATIATAPQAAPATPGEGGARPTALLPMTQLLRISAYWLGLTAIDAAVGLFITNRLEFDKLVAHGRRRHVDVPDRHRRGDRRDPDPAHGRLHQRLHRVSRWGRRKPYIVFGSLLDLVFLAGIATGSSVLMLAAFMLLLSVSTNIARGPFQGYVPDLVAEPQVGMASGDGGPDAGRRQRDRVPARVAVGQLRRHAAVARSASRWSSW